MKHNQTEKLRQKISTVNQEEWNTILCFLLLNTAPVQEQANATEGVEAVAKVEMVGEDPASIILTIQKRIQGIKVRPCLSQGPSMGVD